MLPNDLFGNIFHYGGKILETGSVILAGKELLDMGGFTGKKGTSVLGTLSIPKGQEEELGFSALLSEFSKPVKAAILQFLYVVFIPSPDTGRLGRGGHEKAHQDFMRFVLAKGEEPAKAWLRELGLRLKNGGVPSYEEVIRDLKAERVPLPPEVNFDEGVNNLYRRMMLARGQKGLLHRIVRDKL